MRQIHHSQDDQRNFAPAGNRITSGLDYSSTPLLGREGCSSRLSFCGVADALLSFSALSLFTSRIRLSCILARASKDALSAIFWSSGDGSRSSVSLSPLTSVGYDFASAIMVSPLGDTATKSGPLEASAKRLINSPTEIFSDGVPGGSASKTIVIEPIPLEADRNDSCNRRTISALIERLFALAAFSISAFSSAGILNRKCGSSFAMTLCASYPA